MAEDDYRSYRADQAAKFDRGVAGSIYIIRPRDTSVALASVACNYNRDFLPDELDGIISHEEFVRMIDEVWKREKCQIVGFEKQLKRSTLLPIFCQIDRVLVYTQFTGDALCFCFRKRTSFIHEILVKYNRNLSERGYYWYALFVRI